MKSFTERNTFVLGLAGIVVILLGTIGSLVFNASFLATLAGNYTVHAEFPDTGGLRGGDEVSVAGVAVGTVGGIRQSGNGVDVSLKINHGVQLTADTRAAIRVASLLGRKEVGLTTGNAWDHLLKRGDVIPSSRTSSPTGVLDVQNNAQTALAQLDAQSLNTFIADLAKVTGGKRAQVVTIVDNLDRLTSTVNDRHDQVVSLIDSANTVSGSLASRNQELLGIVSNLDVVIGGLATRQSELTRLLDSTQAASGQIASLVGDNRTKLDSILAELHTDLGIVGQHQVDLAQSLAYLGSAIEGFQSIGYSGTNNAPQSWGNVFSVGVGPASADPVFGCGGALFQSLDVILGPDPASCSQATGPVSGAPVSAVPQSAGPSATTAPTSTPSGAAGAGLAPGRAATGTLLPAGSATTTADSLDALLVPLLVGGR